MKLEKSVLHVGKQLVYQLDITNNDAKQALKPRGSYFKITVKSKRLISRK